MGLPPTSVAGSAAAAAATRALIMNPAAAAYLAAGAGAAPFLYGNNGGLNNALSYAREWQAKLRELQESTKLNKNNSPRRSPSKDSNPSPLPLPPGLNIHGPTPSVSITPSKRSS